MSSVESGRVPPPVPLALVLCDGIWRELRNGKEIFCSAVFRQSRLENFRSFNRCFAFMSRLTNGRGKIPLKIVLVDVDEERAVIEVDAEAAFPDVRLDCHNRCGDE